LAEGFGGAPVPASMTMAGSSVVPV
jgi:hypothetical protein